MATKVRQLSDELGLLPDNEAAERTSPQEDVLSERGTGLGGLPLFKFALPEDLDLRTYYQNMKDSHNFIPYNKEMRLYPLDKLYAAIQCATDGASDPIWGPRILCPDRFAIYRAKTTEFKTHDNASYNIVFLTRSMKLYNDKALSGKAIESMWNILSQTMHLQEEHQRGSKSFEIVLSLLESENTKGNRPVITCYIFNIETEMISWPGRGINLWSDRFLGHDGFRVDRLVDIENTLERHKWAHRKTFPLGRVPRARLTELVQWLNVDNNSNGNKGFFKFRLRPDDINTIKVSLGSLEKLVGEDLDSEEFITDSPLIFSLSEARHTLSTLDLHRGARYPCAGQDDATDNRTVQDMSSNWLFHILNLALLNRALPLSKFFRRTIGGTHSVTISQTSYLFIRIDQRCTVNAVVCAIIIAGNVAFLAIPIYGDDGEPNKTPDAFSFLSLCFSLCSLVASQVLSHTINTMPENCTDTLSFLMRQTEVLFFNGADGLALTCAFPEAFTIWSVLFIGIAVLILMMKTSDPLRWEHRLYIGTIVICGLSVIWLGATYMYTWSEIGDRLTSAFRSGPQNPYDAKASAPTPRPWAPRNFGQQRTPLPTYTPNPTPEGDSMEAGSRNLSNAAAMLSTPPPSLSSRNSGNQCMPGPDHAAPNEVSLVRPSLQQSGSPRGSPAAV